MTVWERVAAALAGLGIPVSAGKKLVATGGELPEQYAVYFLVDGVGTEHADNAETLRLRRVQVSIFSRSGLATLPDVAGAMTAAGFTRGPERELPMDQVTSHFGLALDFYDLSEE